MRVHTIHLADLRVESKINSVDDGTMVWVVRLTQPRDPRLVFGKRGSGGHVSTGDGLNIAAFHASEIAARLARTASTRAPDTFAAILTTQEQVGDDGEGADGPGTSSAFADPTGLANRSTATPGEQR